MLFSSPRVLVVVIIAVVYIATRSSHDRSTNRTVASPDDEHSVVVTHEAMAGPPGRQASADDLARWVALGLVSSEQAEAIRTCRRRPNPPSVARHQFSSWSWG